MQATSVATIDSAVDFRFDHDDDLSDLGGAASRFKFNVAAIALLKRLEAESRPHGDLTQEKRRTLARYTGWGDSDVLSRAFPSGNYSWSRPCSELQDLLTRDETQSLRASSLNAHFTSLPIIRAIYAALDHFGLDPHSGERVLELDSGLFDRARPVGATKASNYRACRRRRPFSRRDAAIAQSQFRTRHLRD